MSKFRDALDIANLTGEFVEVLTKDRGVIIGYPTNYTDNYDDVYYDDINDSYKNMHNSNSKSLFRDGYDLVINDYNGDIVYFDEIIEVKHHDPITTGTINNFKEFVLYINLYTIIDGKYVKNNRMPMQATQTLANTLEAV